MYTKNKNKSEQIMAKLNKKENNTCPIAGSINIFGGKWKSEILYYINLGPRRFNELRRLIPEVTQRMLTQQLRELQRDEAVYGDTSQSGVFNDQLRQFINTYIQSA